MHKVPYCFKTDKVIKYIRYADDFLIGIKGNRKDCEDIKSKFSEFISQKLKRELSEEKTLITHSSQYARFLGYDIQVRRNQTVKPYGNHVSRTLNYKVELNIPFSDKIMPFLFEKSAIQQNKNGKIKPAPRKYLYRCTDLEIISSYNSELRGICNYYGLASNFARLDYFAYLMKYSCLKTLARKYNSTTKKCFVNIMFKMVAGELLILPQKGKNIVNLQNIKQDCKNTKKCNETIINFGTRHAGMTTTFEKRLSAKICELCEKTDVSLEIHHINKVKNLKGKQEWERIMIAKKRKTIAVCKACHYKIHHP